VNSICVTCGVQYGETPTPPEHCLICEDERQYVGFNGQQWTTLDDLRSLHTNELTVEEPGLTSIITEPKFAIGQRCFVVQSPTGNLLWECLSFIDDRTVEAIRELGGVTAIAISHPHYYSSLVEWSRALGDVPVYLHSADGEWVMRPDSCIQHWDGETRQVGDGLTLIRGGGHFEGGTMLHWKQGADGRGALLGGDIIQVVADRKHVTFMYSYPNFIPLPASQVKRVTDAVEPYEFARVYGIWPGLVIREDGKGAVRRSRDRYLKVITP
jgi:hypothetical protein